GVFRSSDGGATWTEIDDKAFSQLNAAANLKLGVQSINIPLNGVPLAATILTVGAAVSAPQGTHLAGVFLVIYSDVTPRTWTSYAPPDSSLAWDVGLSALTVDPTNTSVVYVVGEAHWFFRLDTSSKNGSWTSLSGSGAFGGATDGVAPHADPRSLT